MNNKKAVNKFVIALGGSVAFPKEIKTSYLRSFYLFLEEEINKGKKFIIVSGGGYIPRKYQEAAFEITNIPDEDKDWIGIHGTRLNAHFLRTVFRKWANPIVLDERQKVTKFGKYPLIIASGWEPGWSTDYVACRIAVDFGIKKIIVLGKPSHVYVTNQVNQKNEPIENLKWADYMKIIPSNWMPGLHAPVDPVASRLAKAENLEAIVADGKDLKKKKKILEQKRFKGTVIK